MGRPRDSDAQTAGGAVTVRNAVGEGEAGWEVLQRNIPRREVRSPGGRLLSAVLLSCVLSLGFVLSGCATTGAPDVPGRGEALTTRRKIPDGWTLRPASEEAFGETDSSSVRFEALRDGPVVVNTWATWCPPCVEEIGSLQSLHEGSRKGVRVVLMSEEDQETVRRFARKRDVSVPMYVADGISAPLEGERLPHTYVAGPEGQVVYRRVGTANWNADRVYRFLSRFEAGPAADASSTDESLPGSSFCHTGPVGRHAGMSLPQSSAHQAKSTAHPTPVRSSRAASTRRLCPVPSSERTSRHSLPLRRDAFPSR